MKQRAVDHQRAITHAGHGSAELSGGESPGAGHGSAELPDDESYRAEQLSAEQLELAGVLEGSTAFRGPAQVVVDLTNRCNNNCIGCWTESPLLRDKAPSAAWHGQELSLEIMLHLLDDLADLGTQRIRFTGGGEPLIHPALPHILRACRERGIKPCLTSNGTLLTPELVRLFIELPVEELAISLWAASPETYSRTHPNKTGRTFSRITRAVAELCQQKRGRPLVTLANVLMAMNSHEAEQMYDYARQLGANAIYYTLLDPILDRTEGLLLNGDQVAELRQALERVQRANLRFPAAEQLELQNWEGFKHRVEVAAHQRRGHYDAERIDTLPCYVGWIFCRIMASGAVAPCCRGVKMTLGNIHEEGFKKIWHSPRYTEFRKKAKTLSKKDPYFAPLQCQMTCDNLMHNEQLHQRLEQLPAGEKRRLEQFIAARRRTVGR